MSHVAHVDGSLVPIDEATVPVTDRGFLYGDGVFETIRCYNGELFEWDRHRSRLVQSCEHIGIDYDIRTLGVRRRVEETLEANELSDAYVRLSLTRGSQPGRLTPDTTVDPTVVVLVEPLPRGGIDGSPVWEGPATCVISSVERIANAAIPAAAKTHNYLNGILARLDAREADADEAVLLDADGRVTEGATSNVFFVADGGLCTPTTRHHPVLPGITRAVVLELAEALDMPVQEATWTADDLRSAEEVFLTNSTWEIRPVSQIDGTRFETGPITQQLRDRFLARVENTCYESSK